MAATRAQLRPMGVGDLLDEVFGLYRRNFGLFAGVVAVLAVPQTIVSLLFALHSTPAVFVKTGLNTYSFHGDALVQTLVFAIPSLVISILFAQLIIAAMARAVSQRYLGREISVKEAYLGIGSGTVVTLLIALLRLFVILIIGLALFFIPFIYLLVRYLFISPVIVLEQVGVGKAFARSAELVRGSWWRVFGIFLLLVVIVGIISAVILFILAAALGSVLSLNQGTGGIIWREVIGAVISIFVQPIELVGLLLLYYDLRIRKEGFDLEVAVENMGRPPQVV